MNRGLRTLTLTLMASALLVMLAVPAAAHTPGIDRMVNAGWTCVDLGPLGIHCFNEPSSAVFAGEGPTSVQVRVFTVDQDGHETYQGTELLLRSDVFERNPNERPCPQDGGHWHDLSGEGLPYYACHHYDTSG